MELGPVFENLVGTLGENLPRFGMAVAILVGGWIVALIARAGVRRILRGLSADDHIESSTGRKIGAENGVAAVVYYLVLGLTAVAFLNALELRDVSSSMQGLIDQALAFLPRVFAAGALMVVAWVLASLVRGISTKALSATALDDKLASEAGVRPVSESLGNVLYWLVVLLFLPAVLDALAMEGLLSPVQSMVDSILAMLPNVFAAGIIGTVGWFVARILRDLVENLLSAAGVDRLGERAGLTGQTGLSSLAGLMVYIFTFLPALIAALHTLQIEAISGPATEMLGTFMAAIPNVFAAALILGVAWAVSRFLAELATNLLEGVGADSLPDRLGVAAIVPEGQSVSKLAGAGIIFFAMLFAVVEAANRLALTGVSDVVGVMIEFGGQVLLGLTIIAIGFWLSSLAHDAVGRMRSDGSSAVAGVVRFAILGVVFAMGLRAMGLADDIVNLAFGLSLGSVAVAVALSFGLGGREAAGRQMEHWLSQLRN